MSRRVLSTLLALVSAAGCAAQAGSARGTDPLQLAAEPGWIVAGPTPELRQPGVHDCGATSLAMIAGHWGVPLSLQQAVAALPASRAQGTRLGDLRDLARAHGLAAHAIVGDRETLAHELRAGRPVIVGLHVQSLLDGTTSHYEVVVAVNPGAGLFVTLDPSRGARTRSWQELDHEWRAAGRPTLVVLGPASS